MVSPGHDIPVIGSTPVVGNRPGMALAVATPAARVGKMHHKSLRGQIVELVHEEETVLGQRAAMDFQN
jgi:hypothetical protein